MSPTVLRIFLIFVILLCMISMCWTDSEVGISLILVITLPTPITEYQGWTGDEVDLNSTPKVVLDEH